jgi:hypothetical protein
MDLRFSDNPGFRIKDHSIQLNRDLWISHMDLGFAKILRIILIWFGSSCDLIPKFYQSDNSTRKAI